MRLEPILLASTGLYAGMHTTVSVVGVSALLATSDPEKGWKVLYNKAKVLAITSIITTTTTGLSLYFSSDKKDPLLLCISGLSFAILPFTLIFMGSTNATLMTIKSKGADSEDSDIRKLIHKWSKLQWTRTALSLGAFATTVYWICKK